MKILRIILIFFEFLTEFTIAANLNYGTILQNVDPERVSADRK